MKGDKLFSFDTYKKLSANILLIDLIIFTILSIVFSLITFNFTNLFNLFNLFFVIVGFVSVILLEVAAYYIYKAYNLQQEMDLFV